MRKKRNQDLREQARKMAKLGGIFVFGGLGLICLSIGVGCWRAHREEQRQITEREERITELGKNAGDEIDPTPPTPVPAIVDSWYKGAQMVPSKELGEDSDWHIAVYGNITDQGLDDSMAESRNLIDSELAKSLSALFMIEVDEGQCRSFDDYSKTPVTIAPGKSYQIEFDCTRYNSLLPVDQNTMKYFIAPTRLRKDDKSAITFALYDEENRQFHQICVPFKTNDFVEIKYALDDAFLKETWGQVYRLCFDVTETDPWPNPEMIPDAPPEVDEPSDTE